MAGLNFRTSIISGSVLAVASLLFFFFSGFTLFLSFMMAAVLVYVMFVITVNVYKYIYRRQDMKALQLAVYVFYGKLAFLGIMFFVAVRFVPVNIIAFLIFFAILFIIFLGLEVFLLYRGRIFKK
jgi:hypothetical protein